MCSVIIVHILKSIFVFIEVQLVSYIICVNVPMIVEMVSSSLYNRFESYAKTLHDSFHLSEELALYMGGHYSCVSFLYLLCSV